MKFLGRLFVILVICGLSFAFRHKHRFHFNNERASGKKIQKARDNPTAEKDNVKQAVSQEKKENNEFFKIKSEVMKKAEEIIKEKKEANIEENSKTALAKARQEYIFNQKENYTSAQIIHRITPYAKQQLGLLNDPNRELLYDFELLDASNAKSQFKEKPQLVSPILEMTVTNSLTPKYSHSQNYKDLWRTFVGQKFHKVSYDGTNPEDPFQSSISSKSVPITMRKSEGDMDSIIDHHLNGVENNQVKGSLYETHSSSTFTPSINVSSGDLDDDGRKIFKVTAKTVRRRRRR